MDPCEPGLSWQVSQGCGIAQISLDRYMVLDTVSIHRALPNYRTDSVPTTQPAHIRQVKLVSLLRIPWSRTPVSLCCLFVQQYRGPSPQPLSSLCSLSTVYLMWHAPSRPGNSLSSSVTRNPEGEENNAHLKGVREKAERQLAGGSV